jgi:hypothetical protein
MVFYSGEYVGVERQEVCSEPCMFGYETVELGLAESEVHP